MLLVGSQAAAYHFPDLSTADTVRDLWVTQADLEAQGVDLPAPDPAGHRADARLPVYTCHRPDGVYRLLLVPESDARLLFILANQDQPLLENESGWRIRIATPASVALIMRAFLYDPTGWHRHIVAWHRLLSRLEQPVGTLVEREAYFELRAEVIARLDDTATSYFNMKVTNEAFFNDFKYPLLRVHEHDDLHRATCYGAVPIYQQLKEDKDLAYVPPSGFEALGHEDRIRMVREECYALALERVLIPAADAGIPWDENDGFQHALRRVCTTLARGWFRDFAIDHYPEVSRYDKPFLDEYRKLVAAGKLQRNEPGPADVRGKWLSEYLEQQSARDREAALHHRM